MRRSIYTTNAIESVNMTLRKASRNHRIFPDDESAIKVMYLAAQNISKKWTTPIRNWGVAFNWFAIVVGDLKARQYGERDNLRNIEYLLDISQ
ncbi:MAG: transposase [Candidatus Melainabacteria bacterium]|nr:transposase [Candidatus Melainabacteria bacterium]